MIIKCILLGTSLMYNMSEGSGEEHRQYILPVERTTILTYINGRAGRQWLKVTSGDLAVSLQVTDAEVTIDTLIAQCNELVTTGG